MRILVLIKQVPDDSVRMTVGADGKPDANMFPQIVNAFDTYALEMAVCLKEGLQNAHISVLSVGNESVENSLKNCMAVGADDAFYVPNKEEHMMGAYETAGILLNAVQILERDHGLFDIIFCGKEASDIAWAQTGIILAKMLDRPVITNALSVTLSGEKILADHETEEGYQTIEAPMPAIVTVSRPGYDPRYPTVRDKLMARRKPINKLDLLQKDKLNNCETIKIIRIYEPHSGKAGIKIQEESEEDSVSKAIKVMIEAGVL